MNNTVPALSARNINKKFGTILANNSVSLDLQYGEVHALLGENGAGKSTFVSIVYGLCLADSGSLYIDGQSVIIHSPSDALQHGIGLVQQHFALIPSLSVLENIFLGREIGSSFRVNRKRAEKEIGTLLERYNMDLPLYSLVETLPVGLRQQVEIAKVLYRNARIMLFDEPTASLVTHEVDRFLETVRSLRREGIAVLLITHRLPEVMQAADKVTVLRKGKAVLQSPLNKVNSADIAKAMIGEELSIESYQKPQTGRAIFQMNSVSSPPLENRVDLKNISLYISENEILGIAGVTGNGQQELIETILGLIPVDTGSILLNEENITALTAHERRRCGMAYIPQDRQDEGLLPEHSLVENFMLNEQSFPTRNRVWLSKQTITQYVSDHLDRFNIQRSSPYDTARRLSGGHQQRLIIARELMGNPRLIVAHDPIRGLDLRASRFVHETLIQICHEGAAMILFSSELPELFLMCARIAVIHRGMFTQIRPADQWTAEELGKAMVGG